MTAPLPGYSRVSMDQVIRADLVCWRLVSEATRAGIKRDNDGQRPCEADLIAAIQDEEFIRALTAVPAREGGSKASGSASHPAPTNSLQAPCHSHAW